MQISLRRFNFFNSSWNWHVCKVPWFYGILDFLKGRTSLLQHPCWNETCLYCFNFLLQPASFQKHVSSVSFQKCQFWHYFEHLYVMSHILYMSLAMFIVTTLRLKWRQKQQSDVYSDVKVNILSDTESVCTTLKSLTWTVHVSILKFPRHQFRISTSAFRNFHVIIFIFTVIILNIPRHFFRIHVTDPGNFGLLKKKTHVAAPVHVNLRWHPRPLHMSLSRQLR